ncbi:MAG: single-stranded-DNA-specific exonuclease RecJ [Chloroflexia bacterium]|nr:single-stranded-DNA-specific exonuclease RecJ [Chloroflexia bacterium]
MTAYDAWRLPDSLPAGAARGLHRHPLVGELLFRRGIRAADEADRFLDPMIGDPPDTSRVPGMDEAVGRVLAAVRGDERIAVFGDYDADGITSTAILVLALWAATGDRDSVVARLPRRDEGYGLNRAGIDELRATGASLLIVVDCGSGDHDHVLYARSVGFDVMILDHHQMAPDDVGPAGAILVSAQVPGWEDSPERRLSAAGLSYLLVSAIANEGATVTIAGNETDYQDLATLGTVADVSSLTDINRRLVKDGIAVIRSRPRVGIAALCEIAGIDPRQVDAAAISFKLAPRLNAAGRMGDPQIALDLMLTDDPREAKRLAEEIERINLRRRVESDRILVEAEAHLRADPDARDRPVVIVRGEGWTSGVLGIVANKLVERYRRPVIVLDDSGGLSHGSARSVPGFDIARALADPTCLGLLTRHGGHGQAAGVALPSEQVPALVAALGEHVAALGLTFPLPDVLEIDAVVRREDISLGTVRDIRSLEPFGRGNEAPVLLLSNVPVVKYTVIGRDRSHLKFQVRVGGRELPVLAWGAADRGQELLRDPRVDVALTLEEDAWNGRPRLQAIARDFRPAIG